MKLFIVNNHASNTLNDCLYQSKILHQITDMLRSNEFEKQKRHLISLGLSVLWSVPIMYKKA